MRKTKPVTEHSLMERDALREKSDRDELSDRIGRPFRKMDGWRRHFGGPPMRDVERLRSRRPSVPGTTYGILCARMMPEPLLSIVPRVYP